MERKYLKRGKSQLKRRNPVTSRETPVKLPVRVPIQKFLKGNTRVLGKKSLGALKKELDTVFSLYVRAKYPKVCYTCGREGKLQNGHFVIRQYLMTRWEEDNCRPQCFGCNIRGKGRTADFEERLIEELGEARVKEIKALRKELLQPNRAWYESQIDLYKAQVASFSEKVGSCT